MGKFWNMCVSAKKTKKLPMERISIFRHKKGQLH